MFHARRDYQHIQDDTGKIGDDEPVMLFRAKDALAPLVLDAYVSLLKQRSNEREMIAAVERHAALMRAWQDHNGKQMPDVDLHNLITEEDMANNDIFAANQPPSEDSVLSDESNELGLEDAESAAVIIPSEQMSEEDYQKIHDEEAAAAAEEPQESGANAMVGNESQPTESADETASDETAEVGSPDGPGEDGFDPGFAETSEPETVVNEGTDEVSQPTEEMEVETHKAPTDEGAVESTAGAEPVNESESVQETGPLSDAGADLMGGQPTERDKPPGT